MTVLSRGADRFLVPASLGAVLIANHDPSSTGLWLGLAAAAAPLVMSFVSRYRSIGNETSTELDELAASAFSATPDGIAIFDQDKCLIANDAAARIVGLKSGREMAGLQLTSISLDPQPDGRSVAESFAETGALLAKTGKAAFEWWVRRTDGTATPIRVAVVVSETRNGRRVSVASWQDISALIEIREGRARTMNALAADLDRSVMGIVEAVSSQAVELNVAAASLSGSAEQNQQEAKAVALSAEQASLNVQSMASATTELASAIREVGRQVEDSAAVTKDAVAEADKVNGIIRELAAASQKIGDVVNLINAIASQTNLLALNATIEAARAGEAGKGFAVVAQEVKALASQTGKATDEIAAQINSVQTASRNAVGAIEAISGTIERISEIAAAIATAVEQQGRATTQIAGNVQQASDSVDQVSGRIVNVTRASTETEAASGKVVSSAQQLSQQAARLKTDVSDFVLRIRAS
ncbi:methyl-accepting chemotaxis protein [Bradyrhizobium sp. CCBAU 53338]|uniref:methyl-accepting chemotaxis protein n=1 Tax=Bradyrhizobium sp. CCBAU 53338 TaxID=1325111 RepID=UPI00188C371B|nr:methyl-accepting chemotaxis protein [Bradyrhizobium sp. CCBAU 53338]